MPFLLPNQQYQSTEGKLVRLDRNKCSADDIEINEQICLDGHYDTSDYLVCDRDRALSRVE